MELVETSHLFRKRFDENVKNISKLELSCWDGEILEILESILV